MEPSVGSVGDSCDNALAETINGPLQGRSHLPARTVAIVRGGRVRHLEWVDWFNNRRLLEPIGNIPPAEADERYYAILQKPAMAA